MRYLGVDPGIAGAAAVIEFVNGAIPELVRVIDLPVLGVGAKARIDAFELWKWINFLKPKCAGIERAGSMPRQGVASAFKYGRAVGTIEAVVACCQISLRVIEPSVWKRAFHLSPDKEASRQLAAQIFPFAHDLLNLKCHHQRAEAILLALYTATIWDKAAVALFDKSAVEPTRALERAP